MLNSILAVVAAAIGLLSKLFGGGDKSANDQRELGRAEQQNADMKGGIDTIRKANEADKLQSQQGGELDPNDRANR